MIFFYIFIFLRGLSACKARAGIMPSVVVLSLQFERLNATIAEGKSREGGRVSGEATEPAFFKDRKNVMK